MVGWLLAVLGRIPGVNRLVNRERAEPSAEVTPERAAPDDAAEDEPATTEPADSEPART